MRPPFSPDPTRDFKGYGRVAPAVTWPGDARVAVVLVVNYESGSERSYFAGDNTNEPPQEFAYPQPPFRDLGNESIFEYGSRAGIWRLQRMFDEYRLPVTFHGCAQAFEANREVGAYIAEAGHDVCAHGWRWEMVSQLPREVEREHIDWAVESITETCGSRPLGWYSKCPPSLSTRELLVEEGGFLYDSDSFADDLPYFVNVKQRSHLVIPYSFTTNDSKFHPGGGFSSPSSFGDYCIRAFDELWREGETRPKMMTVGLHPRLVGQPSRASVVREFIEHCLGKGDVWFARKQDVATWWLNNHESFTVRRDEAATVTTGLG